MERGQVSSQGASLFFVSFRVTLPTLTTNSCDSFFLHSFSYQLSDFLCMSVEFINHQVHVFYVYTYQKNRWSSDPLVGSSFCTRKKLEVGVGKIIYIFLYYGVTQNAVIIYNVHMYKINLYILSDKKKVSIYVCGHMSVRKGQEKTTKVYISCAWFPENNYTH